MWRYCECVNMENILKNMYVQRIVYFDTRGQNGRFAHFHTSSERECPCGLMYWIIFFFGNASETRVGAPFTGIDGAAQHRQSRGDHVPNILRCRKTPYKQAVSFYTQGPLFCALGQLLCALVREEAIFTICKCCEKRVLHACVKKKNYSRCI